MQVRPHTAQQPRHVGGVGGAAAEQPMRPEEPEVACWETGTAGGSGVSSSRGSGASVREQRVELGRLEAERAEVDAELGEVADLQRQQLAVPAGLLGEPVVGEDVGPLLRLAEVRQLDHRHRGEAELAGRQHPAVAGDDAVRRRRPGPGW